MHEHVGEFELIARHFARPVRRALLGVGDDCALIAPTPGMQLALAADMLVEGRHFVATVPPARLGHKALAVNLSDLAACGARPLAFLLSIAMPRVDEGFVAAFAEGMYALADAHGIELVGGDTTAGPLVINVSVIGEVAPGQALRRDGARVGDTLWVSGRLGDARLALEALRGQVRLAGEDFERARLAMEAPQPRVALGLALRGIATSAIDLSDGLLGDLGHVLAASRVGASLDVATLPPGEVLARQDPAMQRLCLLHGGDDYELLFTAPAARDEAVRGAARTAGVDVTPIGRIEAAPGLRLREADGRESEVAARGFDHFA
ncbi:MAG: thiamine-phosphate kinase [Rhodoferax sp.]|nr:thiamine-phosphate kinase [Rhodoferax sp.]MCP5289273.1 thiamine-phosphate kinase [Burkholderiaceae bacterium]